MPRRSKARGGNTFLGFTPAISKESKRIIGDKIRAWKWNGWSYLSLEKMAEMFNPIIRGWINYYGKFRPSGMFPIYRQLFFHQIKWVNGKYKMRSYKKAEKWLRRIMKKESEMFVYWKYWYRTYGGITRAV